MITGLICMNLKKANEKRVKVLAAKSLEEAMVQL